MFATGYRMTYNEEIVMSDAKPRSRKLPKIDGKTVVECTYTLSGTITDEEAQPDRVFRMQERVQFVAAARVVGVNHGEKVVDGELVVVRAIKLKADSLYEVEDD